MTVFGSQMEGSAAILCDDVDAPMLTDNGDLLLGNCIHSFISEAVRGQQQPHHLVVTLRSSTMQGCAPAAVLQADALEDVTLQEGFHDVLLSEEGGHVKGCVVVSIAKIDRVKAGLLIVIFCTGMLGDLILTPNYR